MMLWRVEDVTEVEKAGQAYLQVIAGPAQPSEHNQYARLNMFVPIGTNIQRGDVLEFGVKVPTGF